MRLIDADKIEYHCNPECEGLCRQCWKEDRIVSQEELERMPIVDVQEVKHGKWKQIYEKSPRYVCTACNHLFNNKTFKFCPNCGARMNLEGGDGE